MKSLSVKGVLLMMLVLLLAACSQGEADGEDGGSSAVSMMHYYNKELNEPAPTAQLEKLEEFKEANGDITIEEEIQSHDNYETKIKTLAAGNELPDLFLIKGSMTKTFSENGQIIALDDFLEGREDTFVDGTLTPFQVEDSTYGIPVSGGATHLIYYNKDLFEQAGIEEFPQDWAGFMDAVDTLKEEGITPIALGNKGKWVLNSSYLSTLGSRYTGTDWFQSILNHEGAAFTDDSFVQALGAIDELAKNEAFNDNMNSIDNSEQQAMYMNKEAAMFIEGDWAAGTITNSAPEDVLAATEVAIFPELPGAAEPDTLSGGGGWAYAVNANVSDEKLADIKKLVEHLTNQEAGKLILEKGQIPAVTVPGKEEMDIPDMTKKILSVVENNQYVPIYDTMLDPALIEVMNTNLQNMTIGQVSPEEAAANIQEEYKKGSQ
ncbi:extracellular solute-binding protein [Halobacillus kuroshimensis]|uniref:Extracellular solute-binding protein n=1 Tax=Halobacillus kuroshimensis TaxID=302481 RepID=A0ABS3DYG8_9BACI|nr:extracellular solute-binding protein [Halobacillus kuroshimensis]MBN8236411.1 extracellular solute-binding protein [Halobacillus kuroshimensis]